MNSIETELAALKKKLAQMQQEEAQAEVLRQNAIKSRNEALSSLKDQFGVSSLEEAKELEKAKLAEFQDNLKKLDEALDKLGT